MHRTFLLLLALVAGLVPSPAPAEAQSPTRILTYVVTPDMPIPDGDEAGVNLYQSVLEHGSITALRIELDIRHSWIGDLVVELAHGTDDAMLLINHIGTGPWGCGSNHLSIVLYDAATAPVDSFNCNTQPMTGDWQPEAPLESYLGDDPAGIWRLNVVDAVGFDTGLVERWALVIEYEPQAEVELAPTPLFTDGRLNHDPDAPVVLYCVSGDLHIYYIDPATGEGSLYRNISAAELALFTATPSTSTRLIASAPIFNLFISPVGTLTIHVFPPDGRRYQFTFAPCN